MEERFHYQLLDKLHAIFWKGEEKIVAAPCLGGAGRAYADYVPSKCAPATHKTL